MKNRYDYSIVLETPHVIVGAAIATRLVNPVLALPLALASHFILDKVPHWDPHFYTETQKLGHPSKESTIFAVGESLFALGTGLFFAYRALPNYILAATIILACFLAVLPDQVKLPYFYLKKRSGLMKRWVEFERKQQARASFYPGVITQLLVAGVGLWWLLN